MKRDRITPGVVLVLIGAVILLRNFGYLHFHWSNVFHLWPIFLVIGGINLLFANNHSIWARVIKITVVIAGFGIILFGNFGNKHEFFPDIVIDNNDDGNDSTNDSDTANTKGLVKISGSSYYHAPYGAAVKVARLNLSGGGNSFDLNDTTNQLFTADVKDTHNRYEMVNHTTDSVTVIDFDMDKNQKHHFSWGNHEKSSATIKLNPTPEWEMNIKAGATSLNFDLSKFKVRTVDLSGGAASFVIKLGEPTLNNTNVTISSGVSDITINVPQDAACSIISSTGLSSNSFDGFNKTIDNHYETPGFGSAKKRIYINISGGLSDFKVKRY